MSEATEEPELNEEGDLFEHHRFEADSGQAPLRVDKFLIDRIPNTSRNKLQMAAKSGYIRVNEVAVKQNYKVKPGDTVTLELPHPVREIELIPEDIPIDIVYEDDEVCVVNKPSDLVVHPGYGNYHGTLVNALIYHFDNLPDKKDFDTPRPGLVHRLDKKTTGLMVIAKTETALTKLAEQFYERTVERRYNALVWGDIAEDGTVTGHIGRSLKNRKRMDVFPEGDHGKHAVTHYKVIKRFGYVTLVECKLETGRTHQIRVHMKHIGSPLFGDPEYGGNKILKGPSFSKYKQFVENCFDLLPRQALHARTLGFTHPGTGKFMQFESELPEDFTSVLDKWERRAE
ncbi:RluA family pseudouridine synthase [Sanyastnella coralliicola]|uniref:RluA family pseudouridine synthase n=1 Tax=Sanyastnella coralliicola TaxID=3069118 RepID=UPI0027BAC701|nr:RluA family pseudouridine synthase [Longitalea sp. SCSIO 12813]